MGKLPRNTEIVDVHVDSDHKVYTLLKSKCRHYSVVITKKVRDRYGKFFWKVDVLNRFGKEFYNDLASFKG